MGFEIQEIALHETAQERYLNYAMSVITSRALPDVRDGLKPVQRRIIYAMAHELRLTHDARHRKSAAVVGSVMAKYHPHGDASIYDAMVRMAQDFSLRYPLVDGQGNFGSLDGDSAAAMRYTEAKLTPLSSELITELRQRTVPMRPNYDGTVFEPVVLPAQVPNLLINGATGIAVGMATNIPPHNLAEIIDGLIAMIKAPQIDVHQLMAHIHAPDFPTGGVILETAHELEAMYATGSGTITIRAEWELEEEEGGKRQVIIRSIPYTVNKSTLVEKIAQHISEHKLPQIVDVRDESTEQVRIVLELKRKAPHEPAMAYLFKHTPLQHRFHVNLTCLVPTDNPEVGAPARLNLAQMLRHFLDFRMEVVTKRLEHELAQLVRRIHLLEGLAIIFNALDEALALIRSSDGKADAANKLIARFGLDDEQADAVLEKKLYALAKLEIAGILEELARRREEAAAIEALLADPARRWDLIKRELSALRSAYNDQRRSRVGAEIKQFEYSQENYIVEEEVHVIVSREGWIKRQKSYSDISAIRVREHDEVRWVLPGTTRGTVLFFSSKGRVYTMRIDDLPSTSGHGDPLQTKFDFDDGERIVGVLTSHATIFTRYEALPEEDAQLALLQSASPTTPAEKTSPGDPGARLQIFAVGERGLAVRATLEGFMEPSTVRGRQFMKLEEDEQVVNVEPCRGDEIVSIASRDGRALTFMCRDVSLFKGAAKGVKAMALEKKDTILDFTLVRGKQEGLEVETNRGTRYVIKASRYPTIARGNKGSCVIQRGHLIRAYRAPVALRPDEAEGVAADDGAASAPTPAPKPRVAPAPLVQAPINSDEELL